MSIKEIMEASNAAKTKETAITENTTAERRQKVLNAIKANVKLRMQGRLLQKLDDVLEGVSDILTNDVPEALDGGCSVFFGKISDEILSKEYEGYTLAVGHNSGARPFVLGILDSTMAPAKKLRNFIANRLGVDREELALDDFQDIVAKSEILNGSSRLKVRFSTPVETNVLSGKHVALKSVMGDVTVVLMKNGELVVSHRAWWQKMPKALQLPVEFKL